MDRNNLCPELHYRQTADGVMLTACYGIDGRIFLPDRIEGKPVTSIAPYTFSYGSTGKTGAETAKGGSRGDCVWLSPEARLASGRKRLAAEEVIEIHLPRHIREIGNYAFYRCRNMRKLTFHDALPGIGGGALTGCRFQEVEIYFHNGYQSALKSILDEIRFAMSVKFHNMDSSGEPDEWEVLFPEHYEEAVENTPARLLYTSHHGAGGYYRQCFYERELDYDKYDRLLPRAVAEEEEETVVRLAFLRLAFPYRLSQAAAEVYRAYLREHMETAVKWIVDSEDAAKLAFLSENHYWTRESLDFGIEYAEQAGQTGLLGVMMDERHKRFPGGKKLFEL